YFSSVHLSRTRCSPIKPCFDFHLMWPLVKIGFPITIIWWVYTLETTIDRLIIFKFLGTATAGYYNLGAQIITTLALIPMVIGRVLYPKINEEVGRESDTATILKYTYTPALSLGVMLPAAIGVLMLVSPLLYTTIFPKYNPGLTSAQILLVGSFFACLVKNGVNFLVAINKQADVWKYVVFNLIFNTIACLVLVKLGTGINGVAWAATCTSALLTTQIWLAVFKNLSFTLRQCLWRIVSIYMPFVIAMVLLVAATLLYPRLRTEATFYSLFYCLLFVIVYFLLVMATAPVNPGVRQLMAQFKSIMARRRKTGRNPV
ncbi:MAG: polysaccharide biosynthesis protein, partial [Chitinivibrionales bacterium]|nr:polysaccharide biosynthesis protein [Chitinivibrionales bacterium]